MLSEDSTVCGPGHAAAEGADRPRRRALADRLAFAISALASPFVVLPLFAAIITAHYASDPLHLLWWACIAVFFTTGLPFLYILIGTRTGHITDLHVMRREQRGRPFVVSLLSSGVGSFVLYRAGAPMPLVVLGVAIVANGIAFSVITLRWKISMHPSVLTAAAIAATVLVDARYAALLALLPAVVWARVRRTRHSGVQGVSAIVLATAVTLGVLWGFGYLAGAR